MIEKCNRSAAIHSKMPTHGFFEEINGECHWRMEPMVAMPLR